MTLALQSRGRPAIPATVCRNIKRIRVFWPCLHRLSGARPRLRRLERPLVFGVVNAELGEVVNFTPESLGLLLAAERLALLQQQAHRLL